MGESLNGRIINQHQSSLTLNMTNNRVSRGRGGRIATRQQRNPQPHTLGKFVPGPIDPPPAFKSGWKDIRLELGVGSTDVTISTGTIRDSLQVLGIDANAIRLLKVSVWVNPGTAANQGLPRVILSLNDPLGKGTLGTREDTGQLSRAAHLHYAYSQALREVSLDLPTAGSSGTTLFVVAASMA